MYSAFDGQQAEPKPMRCSPRRTLELPADAGRDIDDEISASDPDIETLVLRIQRRELNLRPDFQRGEVWPETKRQKLIDTILRGWQVPPIHVVRRSLAVSDPSRRMSPPRFGETTSALSCAPSTTANYSSRDCLDTAKHRCLLIADQLKANLIDEGWFDPTNTTH
jgi:hypothetical protein